MISREEVDEVSASLDIHSSHVQKDYVHGLFLWGLFGHSSLRDSFVLKGGNCFRKGYFPRYRYSRDLDFSIEHGIDNADLRTELNRICAAVNERSGVTFLTERTLVQEKRAAEGKAVTDARIYFRDFYGYESSIVLSVRMDVTEFERLHLPIQERLLVHPYSDSADFCVPIRCVKFEELLASKMRCLLQRRHLADLYDLVFATLVNRDIEIDQRELLRTFYKITIFKAHPGVAKGLFFDLPFEGLKRFWTEYIASPHGARFTFDEAIATLKSLIGSLIHGPVQRHSDILFPSRFRNPIMTAADGFLVLRMRYDGLDRLVEPYSMKFKVRKDGLGREYFFGHSIRGGSSGLPGIRSFTPDKVERVDVTNIPFVPRYEVELRKAGAAEAVQRFCSGLGQLRYRAQRGTEIEIECSYCGRRFRRRTYNTRIRPHKDGYGNDCYSRRGYRVD